MDCPLQEITGRRPTNYSTWHRRALPEWCKMTDGDWFEQRWRVSSRHRVHGEFKSVAYIETIQVSVVEGANERYPPWPSKQSLCLEIENKMKIPAYVVWHNPECTDFLVLRISEDKPVRMDEEAYIRFIKNL